MSLDVSPSLLLLAERDEVADADFLATVRTSLPYAYRLVNDLTAELAATDAEFADNTVAPTETERAQLLRALASDSIRGALERHFSVKLAFQNCHRLAAFHPYAEHTATYREFTSPRAQLLNQSPELRDC
ncbi:SCO5389 family protein [Kitasatospora phosalacinea]|uniref:SCO5389 family protein n=1 Tax=Kitasatospora phosalacinea TaxID=2065 RepID=UPI000527668E|nr:SCO5389 family protein [Kitasatospora phosalacinea]